MIRRTLKSGMLATVAVLAFLPTAAGATTASAAAPRPVPRATAQHHAHLAQHRTGRVHRMRRLTARREAYRSMPRTVAYRLAAHAAPYRLVAHRPQYRLAAQPSTYRHVLLVTGRVATRHAPLNVRSGPGTGYRIIGHRSTGRHLMLVCRTRGSAVYGNRTWYRLRHHAGYVSAHYVRTHRPLPRC